MSIQGARRAIADLRQSCFSQSFSLKVLDRRTLGSLGQCWESLARRETVQAAVVQGVSERLSLACSGFQPDSRRPAVWIDRGSWATRSTGPLELFGNSEAKARGLSCAARLRRDVRSTPPARRAQHAFGATCAARLRRDVRSTPSARRAQHAFGATCAARLQTPPRAVTLEPTHRHSSGPGQLPRLLRPAMTGLRAYVQNDSAIPSKAGSRPAGSDVVNQRQSRSVPMWVRIVRRTPSSAAHLATRSTWAWAGWGSR